MPLSFKLVSATLASLALVSGCSSSTTPATGGGGDAGGAATFTQVYTQVLQPTCAPCHAATSVDKFLDFSTQANAYAALKAPPTGPSCGTSGLTARVIPGNAGGSLLYEKVSQASPVCGKQMPYGSPPISQAQQELIATWIDNGALNN